MCRVNPRFGSGDWQRRLRLDGCSVAEPVTSGGPRVGTLLPTCPLLTGSVGSATFPVSSPWFRPCLLALSKEMFRDCAATAPAQTSASHQHPLPTAHCLRGRRLGCPSCASVSVAPSTFASCLLRKKSSPSSVHPSVCLFAHHGGRDRGHLLYSVGCNQYSHYF